MVVSLTEPLGNAMPNKFAEELIKNARAIATPGKGILAADESTGTIGKRVSPDQTKWMIFATRNGVMDLKEIRVYFSSATKPSDRFCATDTMITA